MNLEISLPDATTPSITQTVSLDGRSYVLSIRWNQRTDRWTFGISTEDSTDILQGALIQCGAVDILRTIPATRDGVPTGQLYCAGANDPTLDTIGSVSLIYVSAA